MEAPPATEAVPGDTVQPAEVGQPSADQSRCVADAKPEQSNNAISQDGNEERAAASQRGPAEAVVAKPLEDAAEQSAADPGISKNQLKKLAKRERFLQQKAAKKAQEKAAKAVKSAAKQQQVAAKLATMTPEEQSARRQQQQERSRARKEEAEARAAKAKQALQEGQGIVLDLDFDDKMTDTERRSLCSQLQFCYSANLKADKPAHLSLASFQGRIAAQALTTCSGISNWAVTKDARPYTSLFADRHGDLVYLTADAEHELDELDPSKVYVIGGLVDRNRHKNLCAQRAAEQGIATARLPIAKHMKLAAASVLTTNQVVEILLKWLETRSWAQALEQTVPQRKRAADQVVAAAGSAKKQKQGETT